MKAFDVSDVQAGSEIRGIQLRRNIAIDLANKKLCDRSFQEAKILYEKAQHLSYYAGVGSRVTIMNEDCDLEVWHRLDKIINQLSRQWCDN